LHISRGGSRRVAEPRSRILLLDEIRSLYKALS